MLSASQVKAASPFQGARQVRFAGLLDGVEQWEIVCRECMGAGFDLESDEVDLCPSCDGAGEFGPFDEDEVRRQLA